MLTDQEVLLGMLNTLVCPGEEDIRKAMRHRKRERPANTFIKKLFMVLYGKLHKRTMCGHRKKWLVHLRDSLPTYFGQMVKKEEVAKAMIEQQEPMVRQVIQYSFYTCSTVAEIRSVTVKLIPKRGRGISKLSIFKIKQK